MAFTYDVSTEVGKVRMLIGDKDDGNIIFQDEEVAAYLTLNDDNVRRAAAEMLETMASSETMVLKVVRLLDISTDGAAVARSLREHAKQLRTEADNADAADDGGAFDYAELNVNAFTARERVWKQAQRNDE